MPERESDLTTIPAVGDTRSTNLRSAGFRSVDSVADANVSDLSEVHSISPPMARCIREGAKELRGDDDTIHRRIATDCDVRRREVAQAFSRIARYSGDFETKIEALWEYFGDPGPKSIFNISDQNFGYLYLMYESGYQTLDDVLQASTTELADVSYIDRERAESIRTSATALRPESSDITSSTQEAKQSETTNKGRDRFVCERCGQSFGFESVLRRHSHSCKRRNGGRNAGTASQTGSDTDSLQDTEHRAQELLKDAVGSGATFRPQQLESIRRLVDDNDRLLLVQRTGWGKSTVYFIATKILRERGNGPTLVISPLLSLIRDQIRKSEEDFSLKAVTVNSDNRDDWDAAKQAAVNQECDLIFISPERLAHPEFKTDVLDQAGPELGMFVVDEAHCISDWGHDFRPDYHHVTDVIKRLPQNTPIAATTATANDRVVEDVTAQISDLQPVRGTLLRSSLKIQTINFDFREQRLAWLAEKLCLMPSAGIVYCLTRDDVETVHSWLTSQGYNVLPYHGGTEKTKRQKREKKLQANEVDALVATNALGMGFDKPDLGFVIHFQRPPNLLRYYQEIGRAGREMDEAYAILLSGPGDDEIAEYFIEDSFPDQAELRSILTEIDYNSPTPQSIVANNVELNRADVRELLKILRAEGAIRQVDEGFIRTDNSWSYDRNRYNRVTEQRWAELEQIQDFTYTDECLTLFIDRELNGDLDQPCGQCANCAGNFVPKPLEDEELLQQAENYTPYQ